jgi:hypothetical protein
MLNKILISERGSENGNLAACFWTESLLTLILSIIFVGLFPVALAAQITSATPQAAVYGGGNQAPLQFAGESTPVNQAFFSVGTSVLYDDNAFAVGSHGVGDEAFSFDSHLGIARQTEHLTASLNYMPFFLFYRTLDQFDRLNHSGNLSLDYKLTPRVILGLYDTISYQNGYYGSLTGLQILSGPSSPTALNQMIIPYTTRTLTNTAGLGLTFVRNSRTTITFSASDNQIKFGQQEPGQPLYNGSGWSGGLTYQHRVTEHTSFGILLLHQDFTYQGGEVFGNRLRTQVESTVLSFTSRLSPTVNVTVNGGPQYVHTLGQVSAAAGLTGDFQASGGGSITKQVRKTALDFSIQRSVFEAAGLYASTVNTMATLGVRRRLFGRWEADWSLGATRMNNSLYQSANGKTDALTGGIGINRPLLHGSVFHISYFTWHQLSTGNPPVAYNLNRNQIAMGVDYQFKALPLGR